jgi:hypothetical protein
MSKVKVSFSVSIDGFGAAAQQSLENPMGVGGEALGIHRSDSKWCRILAAPSSVANLACFGCHESKGRFLCTSKAADFSNRTSCARRCRRTEAGSLRCYRNPSVTFSPWPSPARRPRRGPIRDCL